MSSNRLRMMTRLARSGRLDGIGALLDVPHLLALDCIARAVGAMNVRLDCVLCSRSLLAFGVTTFASQIDSWRCVADGRAGRHSRQRRAARALGRLRRGPTTNAKAAKEIIARYPEGRQMSALIPLLDLAQRQVGAETNTQGWLPIPVMEFVAQRARHGVHPRARGRDLLHHVQPGAGRPLPRPGVRDDAVHAARLRRRVRRLQEARASRRATRPTTGCSR